MKRSEEIRAWSEKFATDLHQNVDKVSTASMGVDLGIGIFTVLAEIACQLADMNEREK